MIMQLNPEPQVPPTNGPVPEIPPTSPPPPPPESPATPPTPSQAQPAPQPQPQPMPQPTPITEQPVEKPSMRNILLGILALFLLAALLYFYKNAGQPSPISVNSSTTIISQASTTIPIEKPVLNFTTLVNRSNALFGIPNPGTFTLSYDLGGSQPISHGNYTTPGTLLFESSSYGLNFTDAVVNYSSPASPFSYVVQVNGFKGNYPVSVIVYAWKSNTQNNATSRYLGLLQNSMGLGYNYSNHLNTPNYGNYKGDINFSYPTTYVVLNGTVIELNSTGPSIVKNNATLAEYIANALLQFAQGGNMTTPHLFLSTVHPIYGNLIQAQETVGYKQYVISVYTFSPIGKYNPSYTKDIVMHILGLLENNTYK